MLCCCLCVSFAAGLCAARLGFIALVAGAGSRESRKMESMMQPWRMLARFDICIYDQLCNNNNMYCQWASSERRSMKSRGGSWMLHLPCSHAEKFWCENCCQSSSNSSSSRNKIWKGWTRRLPWQQQQPTAWMAFQLSALDSRQQSPGKNSMPTSATRLVGINPVSPSFTFCHSLSSAMQCNAIN